MEQFFHNNSIFIVLTIVVMILVGMFVYLFSIDSKINKLEKIYEDEAAKENE